MDAGSRQSDASPVSVGTMLDVGSTPAFTLEDTDGAPVDLAASGGPAGTFLYFMRTISCAQCNAHVQNLARTKADFDAKGVDIVIAVPDTREAAAAWKANKKVPFPVVVGTTGTANAEAGLAKKVFGLVMQSGGILLDRGGVVRYAHASTNPTASYDRKAVAEALDGLPAA